MLCTQPARARLLGPGRTSPSIGEDAMEIVDQHSEFE